MTDHDELAAARQAVARLRAAMTEQADRLDRLVDDGVLLVPPAGRTGRTSTDGTAGVDELVDVLTSAALVAQAARDFAARRIDDAEYEHRLRRARALLPDVG